MVRIPSYLLAVVLLGLAGCTGESEPEGPESTATTATSDPAPTDPSSALPVIEDGQVIVREGEARAYLAYRITTPEGGVPQSARPAEINVTGPDGTQVALHLDAEPGQADGIVTVPGETSVVDPADPSVAHLYVDAIAVEVGQVVEVSVPFASGVVVAEFSVVQGFDTVDR